MSVQKTLCGHAACDTGRMVAFGLIGRTRCQPTGPWGCSQQAGNRRSQGCRVVPHAAPTMAVDTKQQWRQQQQEGADSGTYQGSHALPVLPPTPVHHAYASSSSSWDGSSDTRPSSRSEIQRRGRSSAVSARRTPMYVPIPADSPSSEDQSERVYAPRVWQPPHQQQWEQRQRQQQQERRRKQRSAAATPPQAPPASQPQQQRQRQRRRQDDQQQRRHQQPQRQQQTQSPQPRHQQQQQQQRTQQKPLAAQLPDWLTVAGTAAPSGTVDTAAGATATSRHKHTSADTLQQEQQQAFTDKQREVEKQLAVGSTPVAAQEAVVAGPRTSEPQVQVAAPAAAGAAVEQLQVPPTPATTPAQAAAAAAAAERAAVTGRGPAAAPTPASTAAAAPAAIPTTAPAPAPAAAAPAAAAPSASRSTRSARQQRYRRTLAAPAGPLLVEEPALLALRGVSPEALQAAAGMRGRAVSPGPGGGPLYPGRLTAEEEAALCVEFQRARRAVAAREELPPGSTLEDWAAAAGQDPVTLLQQEERGAAAKQALMAAYEGLIVKTAKYFASVSRLSWEELLVEARAGFLDAVASFDASRGARLSSIAPIRINFALNSAKLAQSAPTPLVVPYAERHLQQRVVSLRGQLQANLGRKPTLQELSAAGGLPVERVRQLLDMHAWQPLALDARLGNQEEGATVGDTLDASETDTEGFTVAEGVGRPNGLQQEAAVRQAMLLLLSQLSPRNRTALCMKLGLDLEAAEQLANNTAALEAAAAAAATGKDEGPLGGSTPKKKRGRPSRSLPAAVAATGAAGEAASSAAAVGSQGPRKLIVRDGLGEMTSREIAEHLGLTRQGVDTVLSTALKQLRSKLQQLERESPEVLQALLAPADKGEVGIQLPLLGLLADGAAAHPDPGVKGDVQGAGATAGRKVRRGRPPKQAAGSK